MRSALVLLLVLLLSAVVCAEDDVRVRVRVKPSDGVYVGQKTEVWFDLMTTSFFKGAPTWRLPDIRNALARQESQFAVNGSTTIGDRTYAVQSWVIAVYPQAAGTIEVPAIDVTMRVADGSQTVEVARQVPAVSFEVRQPEGLSGPGIAARAFRAESAIDGETMSIRVGDAVRRTITMVVEGAPAMVIPPLPAPMMEGAAIYPDPPRVDDVMNRGALTGTRIESTSYVFEQPGAYTLPKVRIAWFDLAAETAQEIVLPAVPLEVAENPDLASGTTTAIDDTSASAPMDPTTWMAWLVGLAVLGLAGAYVWQRYSPELAEWRDERRHARETSEAAFFERVEAACRNNDAAATMNALLAWIDRRAAPRTGSLPAFVAASGDPALTSAVATLETHLYGAGRHGAWQGEPLRSALGRARRTAALPTDAALAPLRLNP